MQGVAKRSHIVPVALMEMSAGFPHDALKSSASYKCSNFGSSPENSSSHIGYVKAQH
ncbi:hypothetical protein [Pectobacterium atrosepticum]|uniref:hypothetical protein n=1 Tax=Pectobacterium atrosepticum TaxID=29471 RepID=UPI0003042698|nr:hypothetical protein [Pectobacterium atrosepticum]MCH5018878.1 hypothetical protein [Pectobacterium atrosepticum]QWC50124.1 hypothetical protein HLB43_04805 [Pectobacterium atrosepticum]